MRWPDLSRLGIELRVFTGPPPLLVVRGSAADLAEHGFEQRGEAWVRSVTRFEATDLKRWFPDFAPGDIKEMAREQVVVSDVLSDVASELDSPRAGADHAEKNAQLDADFRLRSVEIIEALISRGDIAALYAAAGVRGPDAFDDLAMDDRAAAYIVFAGRNGAPDLPVEDYNSKVARLERNATIRRLQSDQTVRQANGELFKSADAARRFSDAWDLGDTHAVRESDGGYVLARLGAANRPSVLQALQERQAADPAYQRQEAAFARAKELGDAAQAVVEAYGNGDLEIDEFERKLTEVAGSRAVTPAPKPENDPDPVVGADVQAEPAGKAKKARNPSKRAQEAEAEKAQSEQENLEARAQFESRQADIRAELRELLDARQIELKNIPEAVQPFFYLAIEEVRQQITHGKDYLEHGRGFSVRGSLHPEDLFQILAGLDGLPGVKAPRDTGLEYQEAAIWTDAGELVVTHYPGRATAFPEYSVQYNLHPAHTRASYKDRLKLVIECAAEAEFDKQKEAGWGLNGEPQNAPIPVKAIAVDDQLITFMGASYGGRRDDGGRHQHAGGWTLVPVADFSGPTLTRAELGQLWDRNEGERGDLTGMLVRVRGRDYALQDPVSMVFRQPGTKERWNFVDTFPAPRRVEGVPYLLEETPADQEAAGLVAIHEEVIVNLLAILVAINDAEAALESGKNPETGRVPKTERAREDLSEKLTRDLHTLPDKFEADLDGYETHFGEAARLQLEAHVRALLDGVLESRRNADAAHSDDDEPDKALRDREETRVMAIAERQPTRIGQRVLKILTAADVLGRLLTEGAFEVAIKNLPFADLCIESLPPQSAGFTLTRYGKNEDSGELYIDAEVVFRVNQDGHLIVHETCSYSAEQGDEVRGRDTKFADAMVKALIEQGFAETEATRKEKARIEDAGEKIGGARKDQYHRITLDVLREMNDREKILYLKKDAIWPPISIDAAREAGVPVELLVMGREVRALVAPGIKDPAVAETYVRVVSGLRDAYAASTSPGEFISAIERMAIEVGVIEEREQKAYWGSDRMVKVRGTTSIYTDLQKAGWDYRKLNKIFWDPHVLSKKGRVFKEWCEQFPDADGYALLASRYARSGARVVEENDKIPSRPHLASIRRLGLPDERAGDMAAEDLIARFGFRGVEFGNWLPQDERQDVLNKAYDAFSTLAFVLGFPDKMMSLDGTLALAFGSRGKSRAAAHYEPGRTVINLTRMNGAGSTAHEFFHALDDWFAGVVRKHFAEKGDVGIPTDAMFATEFAIQRTKSRRRRPATTRATTRELRWHKDLFADVAPWFHMAASFLERTRTLDEIKHRLERKTAIWRDALERWACFGIRASGVSKEDAEKHAKEAAQELDTRALARLCDRLFGEDPDNHEKMLECVTGLREVQQAQAQIERHPASVQLSLATTDYFENAKLLDSKTPSKPYYSLARELGARAFECYVFDKLVAMEARDDYLVHGVEETRFSEGYRGNPYPAGADRLEINRRMEEALKKVAEKFVPSYTYETTGDLFAPVPRMAACR